MRSRLFTPFGQSFAVAFVAAVWGGCAHTPERAALDEAVNVLAEETPKAAKRLSKGIREAQVKLLPADPNVLRKESVDANAWWGREGVLADRARTILATPPDQPRLQNAQAFFVWTLGDDVVAVETANNDGETPMFAMARSLNHRLRFFDESGRPVSPRFIRRPVIGFVSSGFGRRVDPFSGRGGTFHRGMDISARRGAPVRSIGEGTVVRASTLGHGGLTVMIEHPEGWATTYGHLNSITPDVRVGANVDAGQLLGTVGATGKATGPHLHFEVRQNRLLVDPATAKWPLLKPLNGRALAVHRKRVAQLRRMKLDGPGFRTDASDWPFSGWVTNARDEHRKTPRHGVHPRFRRAAAPCHSGSRDHSNSWPG